MRHAEPPAPIADPQNPVVGEADGQWTDSQFTEDNRPDDGDNPHPENLR